MVDFGYETVHKEVMTLASDPERILDAISLYRQYYELYDEKGSLEGKTDIVSKIMDHRDDFRSAAMLIVSPGEIVFRSATYKTTNSKLNITLDAFYEVLQDELSSRNSTH